MTPNRSSAAAVFSCVFGAAYFVCFLYDIALFRYYPQVNQFHLREQPGTLGPPILWYGWLGVATLASLAVAVVVPARIASKVSSRACWIITSIVIVIVLIYERRWFV